MKLELKTSGNTYTAETIDLSFGVVEDILDTLDFENLNNVEQIGVTVLKASKQLRPFLKELFPGVSDEELRSVKMSNLIEIFKGLYAYATEELGNLNAKTKN